MSLDIYIYLYWKALIKVINILSLQKNKQQKQKTNKLTEHNHLHTLLII